MIVGLAGEDPDIGPASLLHDSDGEPITDIRSRLNMALRYLSNWYKATEGSANQSIWWAKIDDARAKVEAAFLAMDPAKVFPGNAELALYADAQAAYTELWRQLNLSIDSLPRPDLLVLAADFLTSITEMPGTILTTAADALSKGIGEATKKAVTNLWPIAAVAGASLGLYLLVKWKVFKA